MTGKTLEDGTPSGLPAAATLGVWISVVERSRLGFRGDLPTVTELGGRQWDQSLLPDPDRGLLPPSQDLRAKLDSTLNPLHGSGSGRAQAVGRMTTRCSDQQVPGQWLHTPSGLSPDTCSGCPTAPGHTAQGHMALLTHHGCLPASALAQASLTGSPGGCDWSSRCPSPWQYLPV